MALLWSAVVPGRMDDGMVDRVGCEGRSDEVIAEENKQSAEEHN